MSRDGRGVFLLSSSLYCRLRILSGSARRGKTSPGSRAQPPVGNFTPSRSRRRERRFLRPSRVAFWADARPPSLFYHVFSEFSTVPFKERQKKNALLPANAKRILSVRPSSVTSESAYSFHAPRKAKEALFPSRPKENELPFRMFSFRPTGINRLLRMAPSQPTGTARPPRRFLFPPSARGQGRCVLSRAPREWRWMRFS